MFNFFKKEFEPDTVKNIYTKLAEIEGRLLICENNLQKISNIKKADELTQARKEAKQMSEAEQGEILQALQDLQQGKSYAEILAKYPSIIKVISKFI